MTRVSTRATEHRPPRRTWLGPLLQLLGSGMVIGLLLWHVDLTELRDALALVDPVWLLLVLPVKALGVSLHELRLWLALRPWASPPLPRVMGIGYTSGLVNTVLPARGGDVLAVALLKIECRVSAAAAVTAVGVASGAELVIFGVMLLGLLAWQGPAWATGVTELNLASLLRDLGLLVAAATLAAAAMAIMLRRLHGRRQQKRDAPPRGVLDRLADAGRGLGVGPLALNCALSVPQVALFLVVILMLFHALGLELEQALLAAVLVQASGSLAATVLPQSLAAGHAASAVLVLATFGIGTAPALALATLNWATHELVVLALGGMPLWRRLGKLGLLGEKGS